MRKKSSPCSSSHNTPNSTGYTSVITDCGQFNSAWEYSIQSIKIMSNPRTAGIASFLRRYYAEHKRISAGGFAKAANKVLTNKEANEIFEYMTCIKICLVPSTKRMYTWTCKQDHFNDIAVAEMLDFINLREKKDERHKRESINNLLEEAIIENGAKEHLKFIETLNNASLDELVSAIERKGWEVTIKHIIK